MDHITPKALGGRHIWENVTASCRPCNSLKRDYTLEQMLAMGPDKPNVPGEIEKWEARWTLTRKPFRPNGVYCIPPVDPSGAGVAAVPRHCCVGQSSPQTFI